MKHSFKTYVIDFFLPPRCVICSKVIRAGESMCKFCYDQIFDTAKINQIMISNEAFQGICFTVYSYEDKIQMSIIDFKFHNKPDYAKFFGDRFADVLRDEKRVNGCDFITAVPISAERFRTRGYNQSALLAKRVSEHLKIPYLDCLEKYKHNETQHDLDYEERKQNVKNTYRVIHQGKIQSKTILLLDDIVTTGFTLAECASVLMHGGARKVVCCALAERKLEKHSNVDPFMHEYNEKCENY